MATTHQYKPVDGLTTTLLSLGTGDHKLRAYWGMGTANPHRTHTDCMVGVNTDGTVLVATVDGYVKFEPSAQCCIAEGLRYLYDDECQPMPANERHPDSRWVGISKYFWG